MGNAGNKYTTLSRKQKVMDTEEKFINTLSQLLEKSEDEFWNEFFCHDIAQIEGEKSLFNKIKEVVDERKKDLKFNKNLYDNSQSD